MRIIMLVAVVLLLTACAQSIEDIKSEENIGKKVTVSGEVTFSMKLGGLSGYTLKDETGTIGVRSDSLPAEGDKMTVRGVLVRDLLLGYYILED